MRKSAIAMLTVLILLLIPSGLINLRRGVYIGDRFYRPHDNGDNSWTYRSGMGYEVTLDWCGTGTSCGVRTGGSERGVQLDWTDDWARRFMFWECSISCILRRCTFWAIVGGMKTPSCLTQAI